MHGSSDWQEILFAAISVMKIFRMVIMLFVLMCFQEKCDIPETTVK